MISIISQKIRPAPPPLPVARPLTPSPVSDAPKEPSAWERFMGGMKNPHMSYNEFLDTRLTPQQWAAKHGRSVTEHSKWKKEIDKRKRSFPNWLNRAIKRTLRSIR